MGRRKTAFAEAAASAPETVDRHEYEVAGPKDSVAIPGIVVPPEIAAGATFGDSLEHGPQVYRYLLWRVWDPSKPIVTFVMCNPSTATAVILDNTVKKVIRFAKAWGYGGVYVVNLFAWRSTDPSKLVQVGPAVVGPGNDAAILGACNRAERVVVAWSGYATLFKRGAYVKQLLLDEGIRLYALELTISGDPWHPLYLSETIKVEGSAPTPRQPFVWA